MTGSGSITMERSRSPLSEPALRRALLVPGGLWTALRVVASTGSTNVDVAAAGRSGAPEGLVLAAERQTSGRGRLDRVWRSPSGAGIAVSVLLRPGLSAAGWEPVPTTRYGWLPLLAGVSLVQAVRRVAAVDAVLKWPNDLLVGDSKGGGILAEAVPSGLEAAHAEHGTAPAVVLGIGLNVTLHADELPHARTTSLMLAGATCTDRELLLQALLRDLAEWYARWRVCRGDPDACGLRRAYQEHCATVGSRVRVALPEGRSVAGAAEGVDTDGRLVVRGDDGTRQAFAAGDVVHLRPMSGAWP